MLTRKLDELARVRALYTRLAEVHEDEPVEDLDDDSPSNADERLDLERLADKLVSYGERLGLFGPEATTEPDGIDQG